jgi:oxygen-independent coproporphyrinogen-3 oxidase
MPQLPSGDEPPADGRLPAGTGTRRLFGGYIHVPFCVRRCGYCDFNTYTRSELGPDGSNADRRYLQALTAEIDLAAKVLAEAGLTRPLSTVFVGGGTPTMLSAADLNGVLRMVTEHWPPDGQIEVTTEANPDSVSVDSLAELADGGFTRVSLGMQSAVPRVLATLDRTHHPDRLAQVVGWAHAAGLQVSLDLIYGTPGESLDDWRASVRAAIECQPDHISAYSLTVEPGTALAARVRSGRLDPPDPDDQATKYELAEQMLADAGFHWYEVSNWAAGADEPASRRYRCLHNLGYWRGDDWWGFGPGAHSHVGSLRWWNVKHPSTYAERLAGGVSPAQARETLDADAETTEAVMLGIRLREGLPVRVVPPGGRPAVDGLIADGLITRQEGDRLVATLRGRLLSDHVVRSLLG